MRHPVVEYAYPSPGRGNHHLILRESDSSNPLDADAKRLDVPVGPLPLGRPH